MAEDFKEGFFRQASSQRIEDFRGLIQQDYEVQISRWFSRGWEIFKKNAGTSTAFAVLAGIGYMLISAFPLAGVVVFWPIAAGFIVVSLMFFRDEDAAFGNYWWGFRHFLPLLIMSVLTFVFILIGLLLLVAPGIYLTVAYLFAAHLIVEKNLDFWPAMEISRKKMNQHWFGMFAFCIVILLVNFVGAFVFSVCLSPVLAVVGLFITLPFTTGALTAAYKDIFMDGDAGAGGEPAATPSQREMDPAPEGP